MSTQSLWSNPDWWSAIGTISAVVVAIFFLPFWEWWHRPMLSVSVSMRRPDCVKTPLGVDGVSHDGYYFRLLIENKGRRRAEECEVYAESLTKSSNDRWDTVAEFPPMDFLWSHIKKPTQGISPGVRKHCDLGYIVGPPMAGHGNPEEYGRWFDRLSGDIPLHFELEVKPNHGGWSITKGTYRLNIALAAANAGVKRNVIEIEYEGEWFEVESEMFQRGVKLRVI